ncbi:MAG TPA: nuclear transport factor 2 family protein [Kofleriaceae bacterium]|jgi:beta-aspartyl-peptidase (threonine type)|nr:nuclear transport factor 2 family protein [Kofleriaceae bacterium]
MRTLVLAIVLAACASSAPHTSPFEPRDRAAIAAVLGQQIEAWNRGDLPGYMAGYARTPALIFTSGGHIQRGWQDAFDHYQARYATNPAAMGTLSFQIESIDPIGRGGAVVLGHWTLTGSAHPGHGVFTLVFERRPEGWRIIHDHTSLSP